MNDLLIELAKQAGITFKPMIIDGEEYSYQHVHLNDYTKGVEDEAGCIKLFAELIMRECIRVPYDMWDKSELNADMAVKIEHRIKQHFGVEE